MNDVEQKKIFETWLHAHKGILFKIVRSFAFTPHDRDDLFQEISLQLWRSIPDFRGESKDSTWIYRVALYTATVWVRGEKKRPPTTPLVDLAHILTVQEEPQDARVDWLYDQIAQLSPVDRSVCLLMLEGFTYQEIAGLIGISPSNVGVKVHRIKKRLLQQSQELESHGI